MGRVKDLWIDEQTKAFDRLIGAGCPDEIASDIASKQADRRTADYWATMADNAKDELKYRNVK